MRGCCAAGCHRCRTAFAMVVLPFHLLSTAQQQPPDLVTMLQTLQENPTNPHAHNNVRSSGASCRGPRGLPACPAP